MMEFATDTTTATDTDTAATTSFLVPTTALSRESRDAVLQAELDDETHHCLVCYSDLTYTTKTPCDHNEICGVCHLRLRHLHQDWKCPICKARNDRVIVDRPATQSTFDLFGDYPIWGDSLGSDFVFREDVGMFIEQEYFQTVIQPLFGYHCGVNDCPYTYSATTTTSSSTTTTTNQNNNNTNQNNQNNNQNTTTTNINTKPAVRALQDHLRTQHRLALCNLCVDHQRDFVSRLPRFTPTQLKKHLTTGGNVAGEEGHPVCDFCRPTRFYDLTQLYQHLNKDHYKCHVCQQTLGLDNQYFRDYQQLERHFDRQHFLCHDVQCLTNRFGVFGSELDLRHHERTVHGGTSTGDSKIQLQFRVRSSNDSAMIETSRDVPEDSEFNFGLDGQAFVPAALQQPHQQQQHQQQRGTSSGGGSTPLALHPLHVQRTAALRQQAAALRQQAQQEEFSSEGAFPTLAAAAAAAGGEGEEGHHQQQQQRLRMGWTDGSTVQKVGKRDAGQVTQEDFPSLPTTTTTGATRSKAQNTAAAASLSRQFAAMTTAANSNVRTASTPTTTHTSAPTTSWGSGSAATVVASTPAAAGAPSSTTTTQPRHAPSQPFLLSTTSTTRTTNSTANLAAENFPSLGPAPSKKKTYSAAHALTKNRQATAGTAVGTATNITAAFPSLAAVAARSPQQQQQQQQHVYPAAESLIQQQQQQQNARPLVPQKPPSMDSFADFPAPPAPSSSKAATASPSQKQKSSTSLAQPAAPLPQVPPAVAAQAAKATVVDMKATLGAAKYKQLKSYTKDFMVNNALDPEAFVDHAAALFDRGYADENFGKYMPELLASCPDRAAANRASLYMTRMMMNHPKQQQVTTTTTTLTSLSSAPYTAPYTAPAPAPAPFSSSFAAAANLAAGAGGMGSGGGLGVVAAPKGQWAAGSSARVVAAPPPPAPPAPRVSTIANAGTKSVKKNAWGVGTATGTGTAPTASTLVRAKAPPPGSVLASAAATAPAPTGSATKFMAQAKKQEAKQLQQQQQQDGTKKKNKQKEQLRQLAFGH